MGNQDGRNALFLEFLYQVQQGVAFLIIQGSRRLIRISSFTFFDMALRSQPAAVSHTDVLYQGIRAFMSPTMCMKRAASCLVRFQSMDTPFLSHFKIDVLRNGKGRYKGKVLVDDYDSFFFTVTNGAEPAFLSL